VKKENAQFEEAEAFIFYIMGKGLSPTLLYHNLEHTLDVLQAALEIAESEHISNDEKKLLRIAIFFHDAGFIHQYRDHEEKGCEMAKKYLPGFQFSKDQIAKICEMILATKIPQTPQSILGRILADADLDYLGRADVYPIAQRLFEEMKSHDMLPDESRWIPIQIEFLKKHRYFTAYSKKNRAPGKNVYLLELIGKAGKV